MKPIIARIVFVLSFCTSLAANAQWNYPEYSMTDTTINSCVGRLYDSGGTTNSYGPNEDLITTIVSEGPITLTFYGAFSLQDEVDFLTIYNGTNTAGNVLGVFTGQQLPGEITAPSGTVILVFTSNGSISTSGFSLYWETDLAIPAPPAISVPVLPACNSNEITVELSNEIPCEWLETATFGVSTLLQQFDVDLVDVNCVAGETNQVTLTLDRPFKYNCDVFVNLFIQIPDDCGVLHEFEVLTTFFYDDCPIVAELTAESLTTCPDQCTSISLNLTGCLTYVYQWSNGLPSTPGPHEVCPSVTTTYSVLVTELETNQQQIFTITVNAEDIGIITQEQSVCQSDLGIQLESQVSGEWYGAGIVNGSALFNPEEAGPGEHTIYIQSEFCLDSLEFTVLPIETAESVAACAASAPFQLEATPSGGVWSGSGVTPEGVFDPLIDGTYTLTYTVNGCADETEVNVAQIAGPSNINPICQSVDPFQIEVTPPGGIWTGPGIIDAQTGIFNPALATPGIVSLNYALNGCDEDFSFVLRAIGVIDSVELCLDADPLILDPAAQPTGGTWQNANGVVLSGGLFNPGLFNSDTETIAVYTYSTGYVCRDTVHISIVGTEVQAEELTFCFDEPSVDINSELVGAISPANGIWSGTGVSGSQSEGFMLSPEDMPIGVSSIYYIANGCSDTIVVTVYGPNLPDVPQSFCAIDDPVILAEAVPGGTWSGPGIIDASQGLFDPAVAEEGTYFIYWNNPLGCGDSIEVTVEKVSTPAISGISDIYCSLDYVVNFTTEPDGGQLLGDLSSNSFNPSELPDGEYTVIYRLTPEHCPVVDVTAAFLVFPPLTVEPFSLETNPVCYSDTIELNAIAQGGYPANDLTFVWSNGGPNAPVNTQFYTETTEVTLTVDDGCSEPVQQSIEIVVHPSYNYEAATSDIACFGEDGSITLDFESNDAYEVSWNGTQGTEVYEGFAGEEVVITIVDQNLCERDTVVTIPAFPVFNIAAVVSDTLCASEIGTVQLTITPGPLVNYDIEWVGGSDQTNPFSAPAGTEMQLSITDENNCQRDTTITLEMHPDFQYTLTSPSILCPGEPATIEIEYTPVGEYTVLWNGQQGDPNVYEAQAGSSIDILITDEFGCQKDTAFDIDTYPDFTIGYAVTAIDCPGEPAEIELELSPIGTYIIEWNGVQDINNSTIFETTAGQSVEISVYDVNGCVKDTVANTLAFPEFAMNVLAPESLCAGETGTIELTLIPTGDYDIEWNGVAGDDSTYDVQAGSEVNLLVTDEYGCDKDTSFALDAFPSFSYILSNANAVCPGEPATIEIEYTPSGEYTVLWNGQQGDPNVYEAQAGSSIDILITDEFGCQKDTAFDIDAYPDFTIEYAVSAIDCPGEPAEIELELSPIGTYIIEWNGVQDINNSTIFETTAGQSVEISVYDVNGCVKDTVANTLAFPEFEMSVLAPELLCAGETGTLELTLIPTGDYDIVWNGVAGDDSTYDAQAGSEVNLLVTDEYGCDKDTSFTFEAFPSFTYILSNADAVCPGEPATIEIEYTPAGVYTVLWNEESGDPNVYEAQAGSSIDILITDEFGCQKDTSLTINSHPPFNVAVTPPKQTCPGEIVPVSLNITPTGDYIIEWNGESTNQTSYEAESGSEVLILVTDAFECVSETTIVCEAFAEPIASFSIDQIGDCIPFEDIGNVVFINNSVNGAVGTWDFGDGRNASFSPGQDVEHAYSEARTYVITLGIMSADGCTDTTSLELCTLSEQPVFIPDIFSPNDDGRNDVLYVRGKLISRLEFRVYSRWGEVVFETNSVSLGWDGKVRGVPAPSGSYYYTITATVGTATRVEESGEIVLIR